MIYRPLNSAEAAQITNALAVANQFFPGKSMQAIYDLLLSAGPSRNHHSVEVLGFLFGDSLLAESWLQWGVSIQTGYEDEICVRVKNKDIGCAPLSMIRKRLEDGEQWDLVELSINTRSLLRQLDQHGG